MVVDTVFTTATTFVFHILFWKKQSTVFGGKREVERFRTRLKHLHVCPGRQVP